MECFGDLPEEVKQIYRKRIMDANGGEPTIGDIDWHAAREREICQRTVREKMEAAEAYGVRQGWDQAKINDWVRATIAATDPENSFYQEMESLKEAEVSEETKRAIFGEEFYTRQEKWDRRFLGMAKEVASWSKDPSTQTGAVITTFDGSIVSVGFNGFARRVKDLPERYENRDLKYKMIVHCERNAIIFGDRLRIQGGTLYTWPFMSCSVCAGMVIQAGITRCVAPAIPDHLKERWAEDMAIAEMQFKEAGVQLTIIE
jgi:dCMP deaminase